MDDVKKSEVEGIDEMSPVEGVSVGGGAPVDVVGVVALEVLLSEKQMNTHNLIHQQLHKPQLTNDKLKYLQWLDCWITTLAQCITSLCRLNKSVKKITRATNTNICLSHVRTIWKVHHSIMVT